MAEGWNTRVRLLPSDQVSMQIAEEQPPIKIGFSVDDDRSWLALTMGRHPRWHKCSWMTSTKGDSGRKIAPLFAIPKAIALKDAKAGRRSSARVPTLLLCNCVTTSVRPLLQSAKRWKISDSSRRGDRKRASSVSWSRFVIYIGRSPSFRGYDREWAYQEKNVRTPLCCSVISLNIIIHARL